MTEIYFVVCSRSLFYHSFIPVILGQSNEKKSDKNMKVEVQETGRVLGSRRLGRGGMGCNKKYRGGELISESQNKEEMCLQRE